jgi:hypothetical protein
MFGISFVIVTSGNNDVGVNQVIDSIESQQMSNYEIILVGGRENRIKRQNLIHIPFNENLTQLPWLTRKKNIGVHISQYDIVIVMHDYYVLDSNWYYEFEKFGTDWDICVHQNLTIETQGNTRINGWRTGEIPGYPEITYGAFIPFDIDCFIPYMAIQGSYVVCKKHVLLAQPFNEGLYYTQSEDIEWSSRVVPCWMGQNPAQEGFKIVANSNCITRCNKIQGPYLAGDFESLDRSLTPLYNMIRAGYRRHGVYHYESSLGKVILS